MPPNPNKLRWRCLRGSKELDVLLLSFWQQHYAQLSSAEQQQFADILEWDNVQLQNCICQIPTNLQQNYPLLTCIFPKNST